MNEHRVEQLLTDHGQAILATRPAPKRKSVAWKPVLVAGLGVGVVAAFVLLPNTAEARLKKMKSAIRDAYSMRIEMYSRYESGDWRFVSKEYYEGGKKRLEGVKGSGAVVKIVSDGKTSQKEYQQLPYVVRYASDSTADTAGDQPGDPLKEALKYVEGDPDRRNFKYSTSPGKVIDGHQTYIIKYAHFNRPGEEAQRAIEITVDQKTNLPLEYFCHDAPNIEQNRPAYDIHAIYRYNEVMDPNLFSFKTSKQIIDTEVEMAKLATKWKQIPVPKDRSPILDARVTNDGTIWVAFGVKDLDVNEPVPSGLIVQGIRYRLAWSVPVESTTRNWLMNGRQVAFSAFVPVHEAAVEPREMTVQFAARTREGDDRSWIAVALAPDSLDGSLEETYHLTKQAGTYPSYLPVMGFDREPISLPTKLWHTKAVEREKTGDLIGAARAFESEADAWEHFVVYMAMKPLREAARIYTQLGQLDRAKELKAKADEYDRTRVR